MMMNSEYPTSEYLTIAYDYDIWYDYGKKCPVSIDISTKKNSQILINGTSGSGKSYCELSILAKLIQTQPDSEIYFADYKQEDEFAFLRNCPRYYPYKKVSEALDIVYGKLQSRQAGNDITRHPVVLCLDEYVSFILSQMGEEKKAASIAMNKMSELLMLGRSLNVKTIITCQRADAIVFPAGSRLNYGIVIILGAPIKSTYEMLLPSSEYIDEIGERQFKQGEGIALINGSQLHFIKVATIHNMSRLQELCIKGLS